MMKKNGAFTILVSDGFTVFASIIADYIGFDKCYANHLMEDNGKFMGEVLEPILDHTTNKFKDFAKNFKNTEYFP